MTDIEQRIAKLRELDKARTQGNEWYWEGGKFPLNSKGVGSILEACEGTVYSEYSSDSAYIDVLPADANFIAAAPEMMRVIEEQDKQAKAMRETIQKLVGALESLENKLLFCRQGHEADIIQQSIEDITSVLKLAKPWVKS